MKINKSSWHYRLGRDVWDYMPSNLCVYFWKTVFTLGAITVVFAIMFTFSVVLLYPIWQFWFSHEALSALSFLFWTITGFNIFFTYRDYNQKINPEVYRKTKKEKQPSILTEYLVAKKNKVCPIIEYVDD